MENMEDTEVTWNVLLLDNKEKDEYTADILSTESLNNVLRVL
jgi:hypothetical protein